MAERYYLSTIPKTNNAANNGISYEDAASIGQQQQPGRARSVISARTGASIYSQITKKSTDFYRTDILENEEKKVPLGQRISKFFWDPEERTFIGRDGPAWVRLIIFYIIFYAIVALLWTGCFAVFDFTVLSEDRPVRTGDQSVLHLTPSLSYMPQPDYYTSLIRFRNSRYGSVRKYIDNLVAFTQWYEEYGQQSIVSTNEIVKDCSADGKNDDPMNSVCRFNLDVGRRCNAYVDFGFVDSDPCFILKLNRVYGWVPDPIDDPNTNETTAGVILRCQGRTEADRDLYKTICYHYTSNGFNGDEMTYCKEGHGVFEQYFFPYLRQVRYMSPLVFVEFKSVARHKVLMIECWAEAKNIKIDRTHRIGMVQFEILID